jgi:hypothetical protein
VCFISIYHVFILDKIFEYTCASYASCVAHREILVVAYTHACCFVALDALSTFASSHTRLLITCVFFLMCTTAFLTIIFLNT